MAPKGKTPTKGIRQIVEENASTVKFYKMMAISAIALHALCFFILYMDELTSFHVVMNVLVIIIYVACIQAMIYISKPKYGESKQLIDSGWDLNMEGALGEHIKDIIILGALTQIATIFSGYFWCLLLLVPVRAFWLAWVNFLKGWFFQEVPEPTNQEDKKKKKIERRMKRMQ